MQNLNIPTMGAVETAVPAGTVPTVPTAVPAGTVPTVPTAVPAGTVQTETTTVPTENVVQTETTAVPTEEVPTLEVVKTTTVKLSKTDKWKQIEEEIKAISSNDALKQFPNVQSLVNKVVEFYKPKSGGGAMKDWTRRVEDNLGNILAKQCDYTKLWYFVDEDKISQSCFSKGKYVTKKLLAVMREVREEVQAEAVALMMQGQSFNAEEEEGKAKITLFNPNSKESEIFQAVNTLKPELVQNVANDYHAEIIEGTDVSKYFGASQADAVAVLQSMGKTTVIS